MRLEPAQLLEGEGGQERGTMMLMVSVQDLKEARESVAGGADIVDVKNLQEALVGSNFPPVVREVRRAFPKRIHVSVTLGVAPNQPGTVAMAVYGAAALEATSVKVGFVQTHYATALDILKESRRALEGSQTKLIAATFADAPLFPGGIDPKLVVRLGKESRSDGILIDTLTKDGRNLFDFLDEATLRSLVTEGKEAGMSTALSGHLRIPNLNALVRINPDIVGVRGAVCANGDREKGAVAASAVARLRTELDARLTGRVEVYSEHGPPDVLVA
ncbi:MAG: (5-formylfuran-3-yl)methyl phosphate synthase [Euryarchaeota archaeon]|nr:(5-formylfuran-3-yl)methyl phosphate synthase [Euryarchaeota archaeon]